MPLFIGSEVRPLLDLHENRVLEHTQTVTAPQNEDYVADSQLACSELLLSVVVERDVTPP